MQPNGVPATWKSESSHRKPWVAVDEGHNSEPLIIRASRTDNAGTTMGGEHGVQLTFRAFPGEQDRDAALPRPGITPVNVCLRYRSDMIPDSCEVFAGAHAASENASGEGGGASNGAIRRANRELPLHPTGFHFYAGYSWLLT